MTAPERIADVVGLVAQLDSGAAVRPRRQWICAGCGGEAVPTFAFCAPCQREAIARKRADMVAKVRATLPAGATAAGFGTDTLRSRLEADARPDAYQQAIRLAWGWARSPAEVLIVLGGAGRGKTSLAAAVALAVLDAGANADASDADYARARRLLWADAHDLGQARRRHGLGEGDAPLIRQALAASVLVVDELGTERPDAASGTDPVRDVLWARFAAGRPTVCTSPCDRAALVARYGGGGERRLFEPGRAVVVDLGEAAK